MLFRSNQEYLLMLMIAVCVFAAFIVISCVNADKFGRKRVIIISSRRVRRARPCAPLARR